MKTKRITKILSLIFDVILAVIIVAGLAIACSGTIQRIQGKQQPMFFGRGWAVVLSGSMEPTMSPGSAIFICEKDEYEIGDIVTYISKSGMSITHRIIDIKDDKYITRGDANKVADAPIDKSQIVGQATLPALNPLIIISIFASFALISSSVLLFRSYKKEKKNKKVKTDTENN